MPLPNFLIVGAAKSGTTSLYRYLQEHPEVFMPAIKEPNFFVAERSRLVRTPAEYEALFEEATERAIGEASVRYLGDRGAAGRIRETLGPETKILVLLRNPIDQTHAQWGHEVRSGGESRSFATAVLGETANGPMQETAIDYVSRAKYAPQVRRYLDAFGRENLHVNIFEEFFADPGPAYARVCEFLGVSTDYSPAFVVHNASGSPRSRLLSRILGEPAQWKWAWRKLVPIGMRDRVRSLATAWNTSERRLPAATDRDRERLRAVFDADVRELESLLLRPLSEPWW